MKISRPYPLFDALLGGDETLGGADNFAILTTRQFYLNEGGAIPFVVNSDDGFQLRTCEHDHDGRPGGG
ncbi:MAG: hypothetical protein ACI8T1_000166 [Verrucomicrobiales bacterium]|jgi:hypothetical protein